MTAGHVHYSEPCRESNGNLIERFCLVVTKYSFVKHYSNTSHLLRPLVSIFFIASSMPQDSTYKQREKEILEQSLFDIVAICIQKIAIINTNF